MYTGISIGLGHNIPGYNLALTVLTPGILRAASKLSRIKQTDYAKTFS